MAALLERPYRASAKAVPTQRDAVTALREGAHCSNTACPRVVELEHGTRTSERDTLRLRASSVRASSNASRDLRPRGDVGVPFASAERLE
jgi:hypothetical protein